MSQKIRIMKIIGPFKWLNPETTHRGDYRLHFYYVSVDETIPNPQKDDYIVMDYSLERYTNDRKFLGDTTPIARGLTAYLFEHISDDEFRQGGDEQGRKYSLLDLKGGGAHQYNIYEWYQQYYDIQKNAAVTANNKLTYAQGHLDEPELLEKFPEKHLQQEKIFYEESQEIFRPQKVNYGPEPEDIRLNYLLYYSPEDIRFIKKCVEEYLNIWLIKHTKIISCSPPFKALSEYDLVSIADNLIKEQLIGKDHKEVFVSKFSNNPIGDRVTWFDENPKSKHKKHGSKATLFGVMEKITGEKEIKASRLKKYFQFASGEEIHDKYRPEKDTRLMDALFKSRD